MRNRFDKQLEQLNEEISTMGALCEQVISGSVKYLTEGDAVIKDTVTEADRQIDRKERDIESLCMRLLLQQQPVAQDLRTISSALKMISDMERIGDQASDIVEIAEFVSRANLQGETHIADMARATIRMVTDSVESFVKKDLDLAHLVIAHDDVVDGLFESIKKELIDAIARGKGDGEALIDLLMIAKYFERIGDHAENIAEWVIYSMTGKHSRSNQY